MSAAQLRCLDPGRGDGGTIDRPSASRERGITNSITILDKEPELGSPQLWSQQRRSYMQAFTTKPGSSKPKSALKVLGRLRSWVEERGLPLNPCGKSDRATAS